MKALMAVMLVTLVTFAAVADDTVLKGDFRVVRVRADGLLVSGSCEEEPGKAPEIIKPWVFLGGLKDKVEGEHFSAEVKRVGSYTFVDSSGSSRTVRKYELVKELSGK